MRLKRLVLLLCLIGTFAWLYAAPQEAAACGGGGSTEHEIYAKGTVVEIDEFGQNVIVHVEGYYKGTGPQYILLVRHRPNDYDQLRQGFIECIRWKLPLFVNDKIYFAATRNTNGSYEDTSWFDDYVARFNSPEDKYEIHGEQYTEKQYLDRLAKTVGKQLVPPTRNNDIPLIAPLEISTKTSRYFLPVDGEQPIQLESDSPLNTDRCFAENCEAFEPSTGVQVSFDFSSFIDIDYDALIVAPQGGIVSVWTDKGLEIVPYKQLVDLPSKNFPLAIDENNTALKLAEYAQWSPNGRLLAFNNTTGLLVWDVYDEYAKPRLVKSTFEQDKMPIARYFSPEGRYLAITNAETNYILDLHTNAVLPDGIVSFNERWLFTFGKRDEQTGLMSVGICELDKNLCSAEYEPLMPRELSKVKQIEWVGINRFVALIEPWEGEFDTSEGYILFLGMKSDRYMLKSIATSDSGLDFLQESEITKGFAFAFDQANNTIALIKNKSTLVINKREYDIGRYLDGDIVSIRWLPSLLYREPR